jgi:O-antigen/teichoic acid export membrane protein
MSRTRDLAKNTLLLGVSKVATQMISFLLIPIYTLYLTPDDFGFIDLIVTYITLFVPFLTIQLEFAAFRFAIERKGDHKKLSELISTIFAMILPVVAISIALLFMVSNFINIPYISLIVLNVIVSVIASVALQLSRGIGNTKAFAVASIIAGLVTTLSSIIFIVALNWSASSILLATAMSNLAVIIYLAFTLRSKIQIHPKHINLEISKDLLTYSLPLLPNNISWWILNVSDRTIISLIIGVAANGIYAIANKFAFIPSIIFGVFNMSWMETASLHIDAPDRNQYFSKICNNIVKIYSSITALLIITLSIILPYMIGREYIEAYNYVPILALGALAQGLIGLYSAIYIAKKKTKQIAQTSLYAAIINIVVNLSLVYFIGIYAAAISTLVAFMAMFIYRHFDVQKYVKITYEKGIFINILIMNIFVIIVYYYNNLILSILSLIIILIYAIFINKTIINIITKKSIGLLRDKRPKTIDNQDAHEN